MIWTPSKDSTAPAFVSFLKLPKELQLMIWKFSIPGARTMKLSSKGVTLRGAKHELLKAEAAMPSLLHACYESRRIALNKYVLHFLEHPGMVPQYLDLSRDTLFVADVRALQALVGPVYHLGKYSQSIQQQVRHLVLGEDFTEPYRWDALGYFFVRCFSGLKTLALEYDFIVRDDHTDSDTETELEDAQDDEPLVDRLMDKHYDAKWAIFGSRPETDSLPELEWMTAFEMNLKFSNEKEGNPLFEKDGH
ncbi:hypothetical protein BDZ45DRAFT_419394 [Acephala macrosclerotiorum]|nr:hypothetical protein BDZ45DRAFT_419394 [Acephala macrosclerotiorum]